MSLALLTTSLPRMALAEAPQREGSRVRVVVDAKGLGDAAAPIADALTPSLRTAMQAAGYVLEDSVEAEATVRVRITYFNEADRDYQVHFEISAGAEVVRLESVGCPSCADEALVEAIEGQRDEIVAALEQALRRVDEQPDELEPPSGETSTPTSPAKPTPPGKPIGVLGGVGIGVAVLGVGAIVAGGVELGRGKLYDDVSRTRMDRSFVDHRPPGGVLLGVGGVLLVAGVTMLVVDIVHAKKRRQTGLAAPLLGPNMVGLGYIGHF